MTTVLAIETSTHACSTALLIEKKVFSEFEIAPQKHAELILPMIDSLLRQAKISLAAVDVIAFGAGPGSFTGIRLATSIAQGLAYGVKLPVIPISNLQVLAQGWYESKKASKITKVLVMQDARVDEVYYGAYEITIDGNMQTIIPDSLLKPEKIIFPSDFNNWSKIGNGWEIYAEKILGQSAMLENFYNYVYPEAKYVAQLGLIAFLKGSAIKPEHAFPVYLRDEVAWKKDN